MKHQVRSDKTAPLHIVMTHDGVRRYIKTGLTVTTSDFTAKSLKLKTEYFIDEVNNIIKGYRDKCNNNYLLVKGMSPDDLVSFLTSPEEIDFISFARKQIKDLECRGKAGTATNRRTALNALIRFYGEKLDVKQINSTFLRKFEDFIRSKPVVKNHGMNRAVSLYMGQIRALHNELKEEYNTEELIRVPQSPFQKYKIPQEPASKKRSLEIAEIVKIFNLPDKPNKSRYNLAKDVFKLSFLLMGMNAIDLYNCETIKGGYLVYNRTKTRTRREDKAEIHVKIPGEARELIKKYKNHSGKKVFVFYKRYSTSNNFNAALSEGLKQVKKGLTFYAARHSWATIALNNAGIDKYTVHSALNHVDEQMKVTDIYIRKDFTAINEANRKVIDLINKSTKAKQDSGKTKKSLP